MSTRRKFFIALNILTVCIAMLSYAAYRTTSSEYKAYSPSVEMQLVPIHTVPTAKSADCAPSCVIASRTELGLNK